MNSFSFFDIALAVSPSFSGEIERDQEDKSRITTLLVFLPSPFFTVFVFQSTTIFTVMPMPLLTHTRDDVRYISGT